MTFYLRQSVELLRTPREKQGEDLKPVFIGVSTGAVFSGESSRQHKRAGHGFGKNSHVANAADQVVEPESGRTVIRK